MKRLTKLLTLAWAFLLIATMGAYAQNAAIVGSQVTAESGIVSGKAYVLKTGADRYITDNGTDYDVPNAANSATEASVYYLISNGDGTWKIKNYYTQKYWGVPVYNTSLTSVAETSAGTWSLGFSGEIAYPTAPDADGTICGIDRSGGKVHSWTTGNNDNHKVLIYEFLGVEVLTTPVNITTGWYRLKWVDINSDTNTDYADADVSGKYVRNYAQDATVDETPYPLYLDDAPTTLSDLAATFVHFDQDGSSSGRGVEGYLRSANGHYVTNTGAASLTASSKNYIIYRSSSEPNNSTTTSAYQNTRYSLVPRGKDATPYIGQTATGKFPVAEYYRVNPSLLGMQPWTVVLNGSSETVASDNSQVTYSGSDAYGLTNVYNGGTFFLAAGVTPTTSEFSAPNYGIISPTISVDATNYVINVTYITKDDLLTINNTNDSRGALTYDPTQNETYIWSSGKSGATAFDATNVNHQWILYPTGTSGQYYLYNVGAQKFAMPSGVGQSSGNAWYLSENAVAVKLELQTNNTFKIKLAVDPVSGTNAAYMAVSNNYTGPIINYNDEGGNFTITKVGTVSSTIEAQRDAAVAKLVNQQTALTSYPQASGWYVLQIKSKTDAASYANRYLYQASSLYNNLYPLSFTGNIPTEPAITDPTFFTYIDHTSWDVNTWQLPDGRYLVDNGSNKFPTLSTTAGNVIAGYSNGNYFKTSNNYYADPYNNSNNYYIGETTSMRTAYNVYPINLTAAGLTAWKVTINNAGSSTVLTCTRSDVVGNTSVYTGGWFFLPTGTTPTSSDFSLAGMLSCTVDETNHTITAEYDPSICLLANDVTVIQGHQTTGIGNTMQALLRVKATPFATMTPKAVSVTLTNYDQLDNVAVYVTTDDELHAESASPFKIGEAAVTGASMTITTSSATALTAGTTYYLWITGDVKSTATEWGTIDAAITNIAYTSTNGDNALDVTSIGNPDGVMRIYKQQTFLWTPSKAAGDYYRIPTMITTNDGGIVALADYRHGHPYDLGKNASNGAGNHVIDVVSRRSTDGGLTWQSPVPVATGDGSTEAGFGYGDPAIVKDANGTLHCFMAAGAKSYANGMLHMGYSKSTDNGATWTTVTDIFDRIEKNGLSFSSAFTTAGTGVTFSNGRMAFAMLGKVSGTTNIYPLYSDNNGATWTVSPTVAYAGGDESKFEIMNDNSLLVSVRKGGYNGTANRGHNRTTGDASGEGISSWGDAADWTDMNANGCNADIMYYSRTTDGAQDVMFHTLTKSYGAAGVYRRDLRLYMSLDQGATWTEAFSLQPGSAAYSSMQKLPNGDLAIIFEDGTIGNRDQQDSYAINYVVISKELLEEKIEELVDDKLATLVPQDVKVAYGTTAHTTYGSLSGDTWTSNASSGMAGVTMTKSDGTFNQYSNWNSHFNIAYKPATANTASTLTLTAPEGYFITGYSLLAAKASSNSHTYTLTAEDGTTITPAFASSASGYTTLSVTDVNAQSTFISVTTTDVSYYLAIADFVITVAPTSTVYITNSETGVVGYTGTITAGTSLSDVVGATERGDLSPLVSYGTPVCDFAQNTYTIPYTVQTTDVISSPTWYYARLRGTKFMSYDPMAEVLSGYGHPVTNQMTTFGNEYLWAFEGDPYVGVKIYNNSAGTTRSLSSATKANNEYLHFVENGTTTFLPSAYNGGLVFKLNDENLGYLNDVSGGIGRWNDLQGATDAGSTMTLTALTDAEELASYIPDALTNYVAQFFTGNVFGAVGDFSSQTVYDGINLLRQQIITMGSSVTVSNYQSLMTALHGALTPLTTGNYRLLNVSTGKYLGFNEAFHVRGYTAANGTNTNEGYSETGQTLSTIWHIDVDNEGTSSAPVITNAGYYLDAVTSLEGASAGDLVVSAYPLSYAIGLNGAGAIFSSGDNITAAAAGNTYNNASNYDHNTTDNGSYRIYASAPARWRLVPASQADITITGNPLSGKSYATLYVPFDCTIATENTTAYKLVAENVDDANSRAYLTQLATYGQVIPAGTGVVLINTNADNTLTFTPCDDNTATAPTDNVIYGTYKKVLFDSDAERNRENTYIFGRGSSTGLAGFYQPSGSVTKLNANRCYIIPAAGCSTVGFALFFDDSPVTGIGAAGLVPNGVQMPIYDLQGRRVAQPQKGGVYIVNGKKVML